MIAARRPDRGLGRCITATALALAVGAAPVALALGVGVPVALAQTGDPVRATAAADRTTITLGDRILLTLTVEMDPGWDVIDPGVARALGEFEVLEALPAQQGPLLRGTRLVFRYRVTTFDLGDRAIPPIDILAGGPGGQRGTLRTDAIAIAVKGVIPPGEEPTDVRPLHPQLVLPNAAPAVIARAAAAGMAAFALAALIVLFVPIIRRRRAILAEGRSAVERALAELDELAELGLPEAGRYQEHYERLGASVRRYVAARYAIRAGERTPRELRLALEQAGVERAQAQTIYQILHEGEVVRFRQLAPYPAHARDTLRSAVELVRRAAAAQAYETAQVRPE